jgi:mycothiol system anti-sigma-R factor
MTEDGTRDPVGDPPHGGSAPDEHGAVADHGVLVSQLGKDPECREALDRLYHFLDGELTEDRREVIQEHLRTCLPCLEAFDFEAELRQLIAERCREEVPAQLRLRVALALQEASGTVVVEGEFTAQEHVAGRERSKDQGPER